MPDDRNCKEHARPRTLRTDGPGERERFFTVLSQVDELQRRGASDPASALLKIIQTNVALVPGARRASVTFVDKAGDLETVAATDDLSKRLDEIQREVREGPCLSAGWNHHTIHIDDLADDGRWPRYRDRAIEHTPVRSVLAFRLFQDGHALGALNLYADKAGAFDGESIEVGLVFAAHTTMAWNSLRRERHFQSALASRDIIGQAKGILMERYDIDALAAFDLLTRLSQQTNTKLVELAEKLIATDHPPTGP